MSKPSLSFEEMNKTKNEYKCSFNDLYCGYGRQPISQKVINKMGCLEIKVNCCLNNSECTRHWTLGDKSFDLETCPTYLLVIKGIGECRNDTLHCSSKQ